MEIFARVTLRFRAGKKWGSFRILCQVLPPARNQSCRCRAWEGSRSLQTKGKTSLITKEKLWDAAGPEQERHSPQTPDAEGTSLP